MFSGQVKLNDQLKDHVGPKLNVVGIGDTIEHARKLLETDPALLVLEDGKPIGVITRQDILEYLSK